MAYAHPHHLPFTFGSDKCCCTDRHGSSPGLNRWLSGISSRLWEDKRLRVLRRLPHDGDGRASSRRIRRPPHSDAGYRHAGYGRQGAAALLPRCRHDPATSALHRAGGQLEAVLRGGDQAAGLAPATTGRPQYQSQRPDFSGDAQVLPRRDGPYDGLPVGGEADP